MFLNVERIQNESDFNTIIILSKKAFSEGNSIFSFEEAREWINPWITSKLGKCFLIKDIENNILGFIIWHELERYGRNVNLRIVNIVVDPIHRRMGIGRKLIIDSLNSLIEEYKIVKKNLYQVIILVDEIDAVNFYKKVFGEIDTLKLKKFWNNETDGYMIKYKIKQ